MWSSVLFHGPGFGQSHLGAAFLPILWFLSFWSHLAQTDLSWGYEFARPSFYDMQGLPQANLNKSRYGQIYAFSKMISWIVNVQTLRVKEYPCMVSGASINYCISSWLFRFGEDCFSADIILETAARSTRHPSSPPLSPPNSHTRHEAMLPYHRCMPKCFFLFGSSYPKKGVGMPGRFAVRFPPSVIAMLRSSMTYFLRSNSPYRIPNSKWCCGGSVGILSHLSCNLLLQLICSLIFPQYLVTRRRGWSSPFPDILETGDRYDF